MMMDLDASGTKPFDRRHSTKQCISTYININSSKIIEQPQIVDNENQQVPIKLHLKRPIPELIPREVIDEKRFKIKQKSTSAGDMPNHVHQMLENSNEKKSTTSSSICSELVDTPNITEVVAALNYTNQALQSSESLNHLETKTLIGASFEANNTDQRALIQTKKVRSKSEDVLKSIILPDELKMLIKRVPKQTVILNSRNKPNLSVVENQPDHFSKRLCEIEVTPVSRNNTLRRSRMQKADHEINFKTIKKTAHNIQSQNILLSKPSAFQDSQITHNHANCNQCVNSGNDSNVLVTQHQETDIDIATEKDTLEQNVYLKNTDVKTQSVKKSPLNKKKLSENSHKQQKLSICGKFAGEQMTAKKLAVVRRQDLMVNNSTKYNQSANDTNSKVKASESSLVSSMSDESKQDITMELLKHFISKVSLSVSDIHKMVDEDRRTTHEYNKNINLALNVIKCCSKSKNNNAAASTSTCNLDNNSKNLIHPKEIQKRLSKNHIRNYQYDGNHETTAATGDIKHSDNSNNGAPIRYIPTRTFVLPADFDPKDSKWTLKHREAAPGLVELMPNTGVYIKRDRLAKCKQLSKDYKTLVRMLFTEIFTQSALSVCSLTGARAKAFDVDGSDIRPGLDENAKSVILTFVEEHGSKKGWVKFDYRGVISTIRCKIQKMREKYGKSIY